MSSTSSTGLPTYVWDGQMSRAVFGVPAARSVAEELDRLGSGRALVIHGASQRALASELAADEAVCLVGAWDRVEQHVPQELANAAQERARTSDADALVALGGGSAIGLAKAVALETALPIVAVATTYSGSEATPIWGITSDGVKLTGRAPQVQPVVAIYDPRTTVTMPADVTAASGMNAVAHCVEAFYAPGASPVTDAIAAHGLRLLAHAIPRAVRDPADLHARSRAQHGAYLAGAGLAAAGADLHHSICHLLGGAYDLPHGPLHAVMLPHTVAQVAASAPDSMARIGEALGVPHVPGALFALGATVGTPSSLAELGFPPSAIEEAASLIVAKLATSPRPLPTTAVLGMLGDALAGRPPVPGGLPTRPTSTVG